MRKLQSAALLLLLFCAGRLSAQAAVDAKAIDRVMNNAMSAWRIPGAAVAIVKGDRVVYVKGYGTKELGVTDPVTPDTLFQIASTSKAFTTAAIAMLADEKKLSWDDRVRKHLEYFQLDDSCASQLVSLRDIVSHRTGIRAHDELWDNTPLSREDVVRGIGFAKPSRAFRTAYQYNNIMFIAAGEVVTKVSGMPWDEFVKTRLFKPLAMTSTITTDEEWEASRNRAVGYRWDATRRIPVVQKPIDTTTIGAGGGIKSSARDMGNWIRFQLADGYFNGAQILAPDALAETKRPHQPVLLEDGTRDSNPESNVMSYALGWLVQDYRGQLLISHSGSLNGFRTHVDLLPKQQAGFIVMINVGRSRATVAMRNALADLLSGQPTRDWNSYYLMLDAKAEQRADDARRERESKRQRDTRPSRPIELYAGDFESRSHGKATIARSGDALTLQWNQLTIPLTHWHFDTFRAESEADDVDELVTFALDGEGVVRKLTVFGEEFVRK
jgi:CubicO group peptidase (beta-lactamase class C family)